MSKKIKLTQNQKFNSRKDISDLLGGDAQKGIAPSRKIDAILLFKNEKEIYTDYFFPKGTYEHYMHTGIGRKGHQDSLENNMYKLNIDVLTHKINGKSLLVFEERNDNHYFIGEYRLLETLQNNQSDDEDHMRRVFVFHLRKTSDMFECDIND